MTAPIHHTTRARHSAGQKAGRPARAAGDGAKAAERGPLQQLWRQLPFFVWLIALWMLLWGQFTLVAFLTGSWLPSRSLVCSDCRPSNCPVG